MSELAYRNGFKFIVGAGLGFGMSNSFRLLDSADKLPEGKEYDTSYPVGAAAVTESANNYTQLDSGNPIFEVLSDDPGFMAGTALGVYMSEKYFGATEDESDLEELYRENGLDEIWKDIEY